VKPETEFYVNWMIEKVRIVAKNSNAPQMTFDAYWPGLAQRCESEQYRQDVERRLRVACGLENDPQ
jgi:hypothetical protein